MAVCKVITQVSETGRAMGMTKKYHDEDTYTDVMQYVCSPYKVPNGLIGGFGVDPYQAIEQFTRTAQIYGKTNGIHLRHTILSFMPEERVTPAQAKQIAYEIAAFYADRYQIIFVVHTDSENLNVHFVMNTVSYIDGRKYEGKKKDYYDFQNHAKAVCWNYGIHFILVADKPEK